MLSGLTQHWHNASTVAMTPLSFARGWKRGLEVGRDVISLQGRRRRRLGSTTNSLCTERIVVLVTSRTGSPAQELGHFCHSPETLLLEHYNAKQ